MYKTRFKNTKQNIGFRNISELDWPSIITVASLPKEHQEPMLERFRNPLVIPQLMALLASSQFKLKSVDGKFHFGESLKAWSEHFSEGKFFYFDDGSELTKEDLQGMFSLLRVVPRSVSLPSKATQLSADWIRYATPVPLYLSAFKQFRNVMYKQWDLNDPKLEICTDKRNFQVFKYIGTEFTWSQGKLIEFRDNSRKYKTGQKAGTFRSLNQTYTVSATEDPEFNELPENVKLMLCQVWAYQPGCSTQYGLYSFADPDASAIPLVETEVFQKSFKDRNVQAIDDDLLNW